MMYRLHRFDKTKIINIFSSLARILLFLFGISFLKFNNQGSIVFIPSLIYVVKILTKMILTISQIQELERVAFQEGIEPASLMEEAGEGIARVIEQFFLVPRTAIIYCGKGHNAGDALVAARFLARNDWKIFVRLAFPKNEMALLSRAHLEELEEHYGVPISNIMPWEPQHTPQGALIVLDGLLGIGAKGDPAHPIQEAIEEINMLRSQRGAFVVGIDLPSGLDGTTGIPSPCSVQADLTITIGAAKTGLVADSATNQVGRLAVIPLSQLKIGHVSSSALILPEGLKDLLSPRSFNVHKGCFGHVGILAGSPGLLGAARLASRAALHAGAGLVTLYALPEIYEMLAVSSSPEVMVKPIQKYSDLFEEPLSALGIGPGLGSKHHHEILEIIEKIPVPCLVDADALNALASDPSRLLKCPKPRLLTPHPGEMERLFPAKERSRAHWAEDFVEQYPVTLLLKGARTLIAQSTEPLLYNTTGHPGMSSGGMGDVLTGIATALLAAGHSCRNAAQLAAWLSGRSAEIAIHSSKVSVESLVASSVIDHLGMAFESIRIGTF
jgi:NAD(P)H-hydrate epimerase